MYDGRARAEPRGGVIDDDRLRLIFTCCHPALAMQTRMALTLRMVGGLTMPEIARAFLVQETAMGQRITRAKAKIKAARIPYRVPSAADLPARIAGVLAVLYLVFNEGYLATGPDTDPVRHDLTAEAIRLTRLIRALLPRRRRGGRPAGADAAHRGPPHRPGLGQRRAGHPRPAGPRGLGRDADRRGAPAGRASALRRRGGPGPLPDPGRDQRRAHLRPRHPRHRLVAGRRALRPARPARPLTDRRPQPGHRRRRARRPGRGAGGRRPARPTRWPATTPTTPPAPTCCAGWAAARSRARPTTGPSSSRATPPRPPT